MIELKNIDVTFQNGSHEFKAVDNVSLKINKGEIFGIVGPCLLYTSDAADD